MKMKFYSIILCLLMSIVFGQFQEVEELQDFKKRDELQDYKLNLSLKILDLSLCGKPFPANSLGIQTFSQMQSLSSKLKVYPIVLAMCLVTRINKSLYNCPCRLLVFPRHD